MKNFSDLISIGMDMLPSLNESSAKHITFLLKRNKILSIGFNKTHKTHPLCHLHRFCSIHSEVDALVKASRNLWKFNNVDMVNLRFSTDSLKKGEPILRMSKPCNECMKLIGEFPQIKRIYYTNKNGEFNKL